MTNRCRWVAKATPEMIEYHDVEWGTPVHDDRKLFEMLSLGGAQAGLSWQIVYSKREGYRKHVRCTSLALCITWHPTTPASG